MNDERIENYRSTLDLANELVEKQQRRIAELESEIARLNAIINYPCTPLFENREPTQNERHLLNLLSWREREAKEAKAKNERTYCAYCGHEEPIDVDGAIIAKHIATCDKHPMRAVESELAALQANQRAGWEAAYRAGQEYERGVSCTYLQINLVSPAIYQAIIAIPIADLPDDWTPKGGD